MIEPGGKSDLAKKTLSTYSGAGWSIQTSVSAGVAATPEGGAPESGSGHDHRLKPSAIPIDSTPLRMASISASNCFEVWSLIRTSPAISRSGR